MSALERAAQAWSQPSAHNHQTKTRWWFHEPVLRHINRLICGEAVGGLTGGDVRKLQSLGPFKRAVSVGCGNAFKELTLLRHGVVDHFTLYEIAAPRREQAKALAEEWGVADRIEVREFADLSRPRQRFDLVYWNNSLHHMLDTAQAVDWSRRSLKGDGLLYMNDYVGPNRLQYDDQYLELANRFRALLPERLIAGYHRAVSRIDAAMIEASDPPEAADSANILPSIRNAFPSASVVRLGGVIYSCALNGVIGNFGEGDTPLLEAGLIIDQMAARAGLSENALAIARA